MDGSSFIFETEDDMEQIMSVEPYVIFEISLMFCHMHVEFKFDPTHDFKFSTWASFPNFLLELWNLNAIGKITCIVGEPIELNYRTLAKNHIDGPWFHVLVDVLREPIVAMNLKFHQPQITHG